MTENTREYWEEQVKGPGKFEAEPAYTAYFWEKVINGDQDDTESDFGDMTEEEIEDGADPVRTVEIFSITEEDYAIFPELTVGSTVRVWEDDNGFVSSEVIEHSSEPSE